MEEKFNELLSKWLSAALKNDHIKMKSIFIDSKVSDITSNYLNIPESIDIKDLILETNIERWLKGDKGQYKIFFRLDVKMFFEGSISTCDFIKFLMEVKLVDCEGLKIIQLQDLACFPWELDDFEFQKTEFGKLYWEATINSEPDELLILINHSIKKLNILFKEKHLHNIIVVVFPNTNALSDFLKDESNWGEITGKAKGNCIFVVDNDKQRLISTIQHEISHIALERAVMMDNTYHINGFILEAVGDIAGEGFEFNNFRKKYKEILNKKFTLNDLEIESVHNIQDRSRKILLAISLLDFIQSINSIQVLLPIIKKSVELQSIKKAIQDELSDDLISFEKQWNDFIFTH